MEPQSCLSCPYAMDSVSLLIWVVWFCQVIIQTASVWPIVGNVWRVFLYTLKTSFVDLKTRHVRTGRLLHIIPISLLQNTFFGCYIFEDISLNLFTVFRYLLVHSVM